MTRDVLVPLLASLYAPRPAVLDLFKRLVPRDWPTEPVLVKMPFGAPAAAWAQGASKERQKFDVAPDAGAQEIIGLVLQHVRGRTVTTWRLVEAYDIAFDDYQVRLDVWGPQ
jgi:hypothetical protein